MTTPDRPPVPRHLDPSFYATRPTGLTVFLRTFIPWQMWRFAEINLRMIRVIGMSHRGHRCSLTSRSRTLPLARVAL